MASFLHFITLSLLCFAVSAEVLTIHDSNNNILGSFAVSLSNTELEQVANNLITAETFLRNHVFIYYPANNITHIVVGHNLPCSHHSHDKTHHKLILPALKNLHHSLTRWGLQHEIKVSTSMISHCLSSHLSQSWLKPVLHFLHSTNSSYLINSEHEIYTKFQSLVHTHMEFIKKIETLRFDDEKIHLVQNPSNQLTKPTMRKLSVVYSTPSQSGKPTAEGPLPPLVGLGPITTPPSPPSPFHKPHLALTPTYPPHPHHHHHNLPPCNPWAGPAGPVSAPPAPPLPPPPPHVASGPIAGAEKLWCVAKPSVPAETLQEAMDYACGEGGAVCDEIQPSGSCYYPDTIVAHASYAFNSYFQKVRKNGGTCDFGGTAIIINSDPSFLQCNFSVS